MGRAFQNRKESMAKTAGLKTKIYSKYGKEIYVCAKNGGLDPDGNLALRRLIDKAKKDQVPTHVIDKAIDKASGAGGENYEPARYEGFGPGGFMVIVDCLTDNPNRTIKDVRQAFTKTDSKIGAQGSAAFMFDHVALFCFEGDDDEAIFEALMMADVDVSNVEAEDGIITVTAPQTEYFATKNALVAELGDINFEVDEITWIPQDYKEITDPEDIKMFDKFMDMLNDSDDVQNIYHNAEVKR
ncbi:YebC/PmpR family DNA-binding transcriptional regulator [Thalassotalea maritima]|uniref:YebC/PmpR family DNA-binding transcriptional regulator n=1 Tax=Thalassotalea maritima TaxID=3242416 RepID=UPI003527470C